MARKAGVRKVIEEIGVGEPPAAEAVQLPLVGEFEEIETDGAGRPRRRGASKSAREWRDYLIGRYGSPLELMAKVAVQPTEALAAELGCTKAEAFEKRMQAAKELAPYVHQRMPTAVEVAGAEGVPLWLAVSPAMAAMIGEDGAVIDDGGRLSIEAVIEDEPCENGA